MKKIFLLAVCFLMLCGCANTPPTETTTEEPIATEITYIESLDETKVKLSTMSEGEIRRILIEGGANIPDSYKIDYIRYLVRRYEADPNFINGVSYSVTAKRLESIQNAVRAYYGMEPFDFEEWYNSFE